MSKIIETSGCAEKCAETTNASTPFVRVLDGRKQPIRNLWQRGNTFYARLSVTSQSGAKVDKRIALKATTVADAKLELAKLRLQRAENVLEVQAPAPTFAEHVKTYLAASTHLKRCRTLDTEELHLDHWSKYFGDVRLHRITKSAILAFRTEKLAAGWAGRTANLSVTVLRNLLKHAQDHELITASPADGIRPVKWVPRKRGLVTPAEIETICQAALANLRDGQQLADYIRLMATCGSRRNETLRLRWQDVDWELGQITIGSDGLTKNHEARVVDFNPQLETHLRDMHSRRKQDTNWLFPSRGKAKERGPVRTMVEAMRKAREKADLKGFGFHDCRHHFISYCVMSGVDYMTIARWVGHKDGGVLIGKVYGHLSNEHARLQARKVVFAPVAVAG